MRRTAFVPKDSVISGSQGFELNVSFTDATSVRLQWQPQNGASEYAVSRDGRVVGSTVAVVGYFTDFDLRPGMSYQYTVTAHDPHGAVIARVSARVSYDQEVICNQNALQGARDRL